MHMAVVGSRTYPQIKLVESFIKDLPKGVKIVTGGASGVDSAAKEYAEKYGLEVMEFLPDLTGCAERHEFTRRYYERNQKIVDHSDMVAAFTEKESGGTWDTVKRARSKGLPVKIIKPFLLFPGVDDEPEPDAEEKPVDEPVRQRGKGPFHLKRITLGSFALRLKRYADPVFLADLVNLKGEGPERFADIVIPDFVNFFNAYHPGKIHAITQAPKSVRNLGKIHPMDTVCREVADHLKADYVELFAPWDKSARGRFVDHPDIEITAEVKRYIGKVVYVLDDFVTTGRTLQTATRALTGLEIHTHAVAYMFWS